MKTQIAANGGNIDSPMAFNGDANHAEGGCIGSDRCAGKRVIDMETAESGCFGFVDGVGHIDISCCNRIVLGAAVPTAAFFFAA